MANYKRATEVSVTASDAINMTNDPNLIVVMAIPDIDAERVSVTYWSKDDGLLPSWIVAKKAA
jgi:hypothetical protein